LRPEASERRALLAIAAAALLAAAPAGAKELRAGSTLDVRLVTKVSSHANRAGDPVEAILVSPVREADRTVLPAGCRLRGHVVDARGGFGRHAALKLRFDQLVVPDGRSVGVDARVTEVDNAREAVGTDGTIIGLASFSSAPSVAHLALLAVAHAHPLLMALVEAGRFAKEKGQHATIDYGPGVELVLALERPATVPDGLRTAAAEPLQASALPADLAFVVDGLPLRTLAPRAGRESDLTNLLLLGSREEIEAAFAAAGWSRAAELHPRTAARGLLALAEKHAYRNAPVSLLELSGRPPELVFEKQCNTLTKRHHVRLWGGFGVPGGPALWVGAASHDVGIIFCRAERTFTHRIDGHIDKERSKVVDDLQFTGRVEETALVDRPSAPRAFTTVAGTAVETDGRMALLVLARPATSSPAVTIAFARP
jgi:hypothetical protein